VRLVTATLILSTCILAVIGGAPTYAHAVRAKSKPVELKTFQPPAQQIVRLRYYGGPKSPMSP
jgi:hypothetical protein